MQNILVTGAHGFLGQHLVPALIKKKYTVHTLARTKNNPWGAAVTSHTHDLRRELDPRVMRNIDAIVHLAGEIDINASISAPKIRLANNLAMTLSLLEAARLSGRKPLIIFASTDRLYGRAKKRIVTEKDASFPIEPYTASKIMGEIALQLYSFLYDLPYIALRFDSIYGPGQPRSMFISDLIQKMKRSDVVETGPLSVRKNFVYIDDVIDAIRASLKAPRSAHNSVYNIGGTAASLADVARLIKKDFESRRRTSISIRSTKKPHRLQKAEVTPFILSTTAAQTHLKWRPRTRLIDGLSKTISFFLDNHD